MLPVTAVAALTQQIDEEDPWSDVTSSAGEPSPTSGIQNVDGGLDTYESLEEDTAQFLPYSMSRILPNPINTNIEQCPLFSEKTYLRVV